jgi:hypothetical protein
VTFQVGDFKPNTINRIEKSVKTIVKKKLLNKGFSIVILNLKGEYFIDDIDEITIGEVASNALRDKKYITKSDAEEYEAKSGNKRYTSLVTQFHTENIKFQVLKCIDDYKPFINYIEKKLNEGV